MGHVFPDLLDLWVLKTLPIADRRAFPARVAAIAIFVGGFLFDINIFATLVLPAAIDPPNLGRFVAGHLLAVAGSGLFAAAFILALQGVLLSVLGERFFRKISLLMQCLSITALLLFLFLFPVFSAVVPALLKSGSNYALFCPPFWFLGIYQLLMEGPFGTAHLRHSGQDRLRRFDSRPLRSPSSPIRLPTCAACVNLWKAPEARSTRMAAKTA